MSPLTIAAMQWVAAAALALAMPWAAAQQSAGSAPASHVSPNAAAVPTLPSVEFRSAFEGYRRYSDEAVTPWRQSNDTVGRIGGWQAYAREAAAPQAPAPASGPAGTHGHHPQK